MFSFKRTLSDTEWSFDIDGFFFQKKKVSDSKGMKLFFS